MKKLTVLAIILIIANCLSICPFAYEITNDEEDAIFALQKFLNTYTLYVYGLRNVTDEESIRELSDMTINYLDNYPDLKNEILEKAKKYEDEIRYNHRYFYIEDRPAYWATQETNEFGAIEPTEPNPDLIPSTIQYDNTPIEDVISSFPAYWAKKHQFYKAYLSYRDMHINHEDMEFVATSVYVSESGFAYINCNGTAYYLLYKYGLSDKWLILDISSYFDELDEKYRFRVDDFDVEKELENRGIKLLSENENKKDESMVSDQTEESDSIASTQESDNKTDTTPKDSKPINYIPWAVCAVEGVAIIALVIALAVKKKK